MILQANLLTREKLDAYRKSTPLKMFTVIASRYIAQEPINLECSQLACTFNNYQQMCSITCTISMSIKWCKEINFYYSTCFCALSFSPPNIQVCRFRYPQSHTHTRTHTRCFLSVSFYCDYNNRYFLVHSFYF